MHVTIDELITTIYTTPSLSLSIVGLHVINFHRLCIGLQCEISVSVAFSVVCSTFLTFVKNWAMTRFTSSFSQFVRFSRFTS